MTKNSKKLDKEKLLELLDEAKELAALYDEENRRNPKGFYNYGSVDEITLRLLERREGFITVGMKLYFDDVKIFGVNGYLGPDGSVFVDRGTVDYTLVGFECGTTISRFIERVCEVIYQRANNGSPDLRQLMLPNAMQYASKTLKRISPYLPP